MPLPPTAAGGSALLTPDHLRSVLSGCLSSSLLILTLISTVSPLHPFQVSPFQICWKKKKKAQNESNRA